MSDHWIKIALKLQKYDTWSLPVVTVSKRFKSRTSNNVNDTPDAKRDRQHRIYILGVGNLGRLFAHALANSPDPPPITLLLHRSSLLADWKQAKRQISITTNGIVNSKGRFDVEDISFDSPQSKYIRNLIVTTKTTNTSTALKSIARRLNSHSTILFAQNGMGTIDEARTQAFKRGLTPICLTSITSHGVFTTGSFSSVHAGQGSLSFGEPLSPSPTKFQHASYLIDMVRQASILAPNLESDPQELFYLQLEKLVVNSIINPLTSILNCRNGELFDKEQIVKLMRKLLQEASEVIQLVPEIYNSEDTSLKQRFSTDALETRVLDVAEKTAQNTSSMLQDIKAGKTTEIDYINGWLVKRGKELGVKCEHNAKMVEMIKIGRQISIEEVKDYLANSSGTF